MKKGQNRHFLRRYTRKCINERIEMTISEQLPVARKKVFFYVKKIILEKVMRV